MSGTSMAALVAQYIRENGLEKTSLTARQLSQSLLMSTSISVREEANGGAYYSILKQGSGLANVGAYHNSHIKPFLLYSSRAFTECSTCSNDCFKFSYTSCETLPTYWDSYRDISLRIFKTSKVSVPVFPFPAR